MSRRLFNYILSLFGIKTETETEPQPTETYHPEDDAILITHRKKDNHLLINPRSRIVKKKKKKKTTYLDWIPVDYLLSYIKQGQESQPVDLSSDEDDGTLSSEFASLRHQVMKTCHALDTERPSEQFGQTANVILPFLFEKLEWIRQRYSNHQALLACIMLGTEALQTKREVKRQLLESHWSRTLVLAMSGLLKNFTFQQDDELAMVLLDRHDWHSVLKDMCAEFERLDTHWQFRNEYKDVVDMATRHL
jgi:hypothetical protein